MARTKLLARKAPKRDRDDDDDDWTVEEDETLVVLYERDPEDEELDVPVAKLARRTDDSAEHTQLMVRTKGGWSNPLEVKGVDALAACMDVSGHKAYSIKRFKGGDGDAEDIIQNMTETKEGWDVAEVLWDHLPKAPRTTAVVYSAISPTEFVPKATVWRQGSDFHVRVTASQATHTAKWEDKLAECLLGSLVTLEASYKYHTKIVFVQDFQEPPDTDPCDKSICKSFVEADDEAWLAARMAKFISRVLN